MKRVTIALLTLLTVSTVVGAQDPRGPAVAECESKLRTQLEAVRSGDQTFHLDLSGPSGARLRYFGVRHTYDSTDTQLAEIEAVWGALRPTVAFFEGTGRFVGATAGASVARSAEPGLIRYLAARDSIPAHSLEPAIDDEVHELLRSFSAEQLALFYITRPLTQYRDAARIGGRPFGKPELDSVLPRLVTQVGATGELAAAVPDVVAYRSVFARWFPDREPAGTPGRWFNPEVTSAETGSKFLNDVNRASSAFRDLHMYRLLASAWKPDARIFAAVGRAHIPAQAGALRCALGADGPG